MGDGRGKRILYPMIFNQNSRIPESKNRNSILKHFSMLRKKMLIFLTATSLIALFLADTKLRQLSDKRTRYFRSFAFSAAESETPIRSFDDLKNVSFVASNPNIYKNLYFGWPFKTPDILVFDRDGYVLVTEDANYPLSLFKLGKIVQEVKKIDIQH